MKKTIKQKKIFINSLSLKATLLLLALLFSFSSIIYFFARKENRKQAIEAAEKLAIQVGDNTINRLLTEFSDIETLTAKQATIAASIQSDPSIYKKSLSNNLSVDNYKNIVGAGFWTAPNFPIGDINAVSWKLNLFDRLEYDDSYEHKKGYIGTKWFNLAKYAKKNHCAWTSPYRNVQSNKLEIICSIASLNRRKSLGVATINMELSHLAILAAKASQLTEGYVFFTDKDERFITFQRKTENGLTTLFDGVVSNARYIHSHNAYSLIGDAVKAYDKSVIYRAKRALGDEYDNQRAQLSNSSSFISEQTAALDIASFYEEVEDSAYFATATLKNDPVFNGKSRVYLFHVPKVYWTMGIVLSDKTIAASADKLSDLILLLLLVTTIVLSLFCYGLLEFRIFYHVKRAVISLRKMSSLLHEKKYGSLNEHKLKFVTNDEFGVMGRSINLLIDRVVENEEALKNANELLEQRIIERTNELSVALSELKNSQTKLVQAEKMSILGQMVAGVTHEVNTPLGYLKNNLLICEILIGDYDAIFKLLQELSCSLINHYDDDKLILSLIEQTQCKIEQLNEEVIRDEVKELLQDALFGVEQISDLVVNLKDFARLDEAKVQSVDVHKCIESALKIIDINHGAGIITKNFGSDLPKIYCMPSQVNQVLLNLLNNAMEGMKDKNDKAIVVSTSIDLNYVCISVEDNGCGIDKANQEKIFEPFFSTAPSGQGTGLGLAICKKIIEEHNGKITLVSHEGEGTTFSVYFPFIKETT